MPTNVLDGRGLRVARCDFDGITDGPHMAEMHANARLIAAAPELLRELRELGDVVEVLYAVIVANGLSEELPSLRRKERRAIIAKAESSSLS